MPIAAALCFSPTLIRTHPKTLNFTSSRACLANITQRSPLTISKSPDAKGSTVSNASIQSRTTSHTATASTTSRLPVALLISPHPTVLLDPRTHHP